MSALFLELTVILLALLFLEPQAGIEPATCPLRVGCSTTEPLRRVGRFTSLTDVDATSVDNK